MPKLPSFEMSNASKDALHAALVPLQPAQRKAVLDAISAVMADFEIYMQAKAMETLRQQWSEALRIMFLPSTN